MKFFLKQLSTDQHITAVLLRNKSGQRQQANSWAGLTAAQTQFLLETYQLLHTNPYTHICAHTHLLSPALLWASTAFLFPFFSCNYKLRLLVTHSCLATAQQRKESTLNSWQLHWNFMSSHNYCKDSHKAHKEVLKSAFTWTITFLKSSPYNEYKD